MVKGVGLFEREHRRFESLHYSLFGIVVGEVIFMAKLGIDLIDRVDVDSKFLFSACFEHREC